MASTKPNLMQRMQAVMQSVSFVQKEKKKGMQYSIVSHDRVTALLRPPCVENGIVSYPVEVAFRQDGNRTEAKVTVRFCNVDDPADFIDVQSIGYGIDSQDKGPGKAMSYATKYAYLKAFMLETGDDPDFDQETTHKPRERSNQSSAGGTFENSDPFQ